MFTAQVLGGSRQASQNSLQHVFLPRLKYKMETVYGKAYKAPLSMVEGKGKGEGIWVGSKAKVKMSHSSLPKRGNACRQPASQPRQRVAGAAWVGWCSSPPPQQA